VNGHYHRRLLKKEEQLKLLLPEREDYSSLGNKKCIGEQLRRLLKGERLELRLLET
jgi:hypothetical protein